MEITKQKLPDLYFLIDYDAYSEQYESLYAIFVSEEEAIKTAKKFGCYIRRYEYVGSKKDDIFDTFSSDWERAEEFKP